jgi:hypothetical protein
MLCPTFFNNNERKPMKKLQIALAAILCASLITSCGDSNTAIKNAVQTAVHQAIHNAPAEFQKGLSDYIMVAAKGVYSIDGTPTVNELIAKVLAFIPANVQHQFPLIITAITATVTLAYITYGKAGLTAIGQGMEAGATPPF